MHEEHEPQARTNSVLLASCARNESLYHTSSKPSVVIALGRDICALAANLHGLTYEHVTVCFQS